MEKSPLLPDSSEDVDNDEILLTSVQGDAPAGIEPEVEDQFRDKIPVVGIGASAGGLKAFEHFLRNMYVDSGAAFVLIPHLSPTHKSMMVDLLGNYTKMPVMEIEDEMQVSPNQIYVIPPGKELALFHGRFQLINPFKPRGQRMPINHFFQSLATDVGEKAIGIVLSGTGTDGTLGLRAIKSQGGATIAQSLGSAQYDGMPRSAITAGVADYVLSAEKIPEKLSEILPLIHQRSMSKELDLVNEGDDLYHKIFMLIRERTGHDFSEYRLTTIVRRVKRRMVITKMPTVYEYVDYLHQHPPEVNLLFNDLLINVSYFFRDEKAFEALNTLVIPDILARKQHGDVIRVWVLGCSTGQEAYSIAILLLEALEEIKLRCDIKVFASDIDEDALTTARAGAYPATIEEQVSGVRLERFFEFDGEVYRVKRFVRDLVVFSLHNFVKDPPFSKLDIVSLRNVLIYMRRSIQQRVIQMVHYALLPEGYLFLGSSETVGRNSDLFHVVSEKWKMYRRNSSVNPTPVYFPVLSSDQEWDYTADQANQPELLQTPIAEIAENMLLSRYMPPAVLIDEANQIVHSYGHAGAYFSYPSGKATLNILNLIRPELQADLYAALRFVDNYRKTNKRRGLKLKRPDGSDSVLNLIVYPLSQPESHKFLKVIIFEEETDLQVDDEIHVELDDISPESDPVLYRLNQELVTTKTKLQSTITELEHTNQDLRASNEELMSTNEELQSTTEELSTSREELQSVNEELMTINSELQAKIEEITMANNDLNNLLVSTEFGVLFLDLALSIRRFTSQVSQIIHLIHSDVGRPLGDLNHTLIDVNLKARSREVLHSLIRHESVVQTWSGTWFLMRIVPYRTSDNRIDGVVITFMNITRMRVAEQALREQEERFQQAVKASPLIVFNQDRDLRYIWFRATDSTTLKFDEADFLGQTDTELFSAEDAAKLTALKKRVFEEKKGLQEKISLTWEGQNVAFELSVDLFENSSGELSIVGSLMELSSSPQISLKGNGVAISDPNLPDNPLVYVNEVFEKMTGYSREESLGRNCRFLQRDDRDQLSLVVLREAIALQKECQVVVRNYRKDGTMFWNEVTIAPVFDNQGAIQYFVGVQNDITHMRDELEKRLT